MIERIEAVNDAVNSFVWGPVMLLLLVGTGVYLTARTGWIQVRWFGYIMKHTIGSLFQKREKDHGKNLSPFQAVTTALAGRFLWEAPALYFGCGCPPSLACVPNTRRLLCR